MGRRSEIGRIVNPKDKLRDMVLKAGGVMGMTQILASPAFREGYDENRIRQYVYQLRKQYKGYDLGYGLEAWELLHNVVLGLEVILTQVMRMKIQTRRHAKERGVAEQGILDNIIFKAKIQHNGVVHKEEIIRHLEASTADLRQVAGSSTSVRDTLIEHKEDFGNED